VIVGKLMHVRLLDFGSVVVRFSQKARSMGTQTANGLVLSRARARAEAVVQQAWQLAKRVNKEKRDEFDSRWGKRGYLVELFSQEYVNTLATFARAARKICSVQPSLVEARAPCRIFGDIHGQLRDLLLMFFAFGAPDERNAPMFVFNGDFVDRGEHQLEVIGLLLAFKVLLPEQVWLVWGNHEFRFMNERYGFLDECNTKLGSFGPKLFELFHRVFDVMPVACMISDRILCVHGGIGEGKWKVDDIRGIRRPLNDDVSDPELLWVHNLLWSDPIEDDNESADVFGVHVSPRGGSLSTFGWNVTKTFCARNGLGLIVRSHQSKRDSLGIDIMHENLLMRVFSARDYEGHGNDEAVLLVKPADPGLLGSLLLVRPQVLQSVAKGKRARAIVADSEKAASSKMTAGNADRDPDDDEGEDEGPPVESRRTIRHRHQPN
jgi:diadenosine tetraphosphatase ApaH/serine/threonine PP2A family protein phosphatase